MRNVVPAATLAFDREELVRSFAPIAAEFSMESRITKFIHHSVLPSIGGRSPYQQARYKAVKWIGAAFHCATEEADQGPIIYQDVIRIDQADLVAAGECYGKEMDPPPLTRSLKNHLVDQCCRTARMRR